MDNLDEVGRVNKLLLEFTKLPLSHKCTLLTKMLSNLNAHMKTIGGDYDKLMEDIIKLSKEGGNKNGIK